MVPKCSEPSVRLPMTTIPEAIEIGLAHHQAGQARAGRASLPPGVAGQPATRRRDALAGPGRVSGRSIQRRRRAHHSARFVVDGRQAAFHANLGEAYRGLGRLDDARKCYEQALRIEPDLPEAHNNLGTILQSQGELARRIDMLPKGDRRQAQLCRRPQQSWHDVPGARPVGIEPSSVIAQAVQVDPAYAKGYYNLGVALAKRTITSRPGPRSNRRSRCDPTTPRPTTAWRWSLQKQRDWTRAEAAYREALRLRPTLAEAASSLGIAVPEPGQARSGDRDVPTGPARFAQLCRGLLQLGHGAQAARPRERGGRHVSPAPSAANRRWSTRTTTWAPSCRDWVNSKLRQPATKRRSVCGPTSSRRTTTWAIVYKLQGKVTEAIACYSKAIEISPRPCRSPQQSRLALAAARTL